MPRTKEHKAQSRRKILAAAYRLFTEQGFERVTIDAIMAAAGLTRGAFYSHFASKAALYQQAFQFGAEQQPLGRFVLSGASAGDELVRAVSHYLSPAHIEGESGGCPLSFLNADAAVDRQDVRQLYSRAFDMVSASLASAMPARAPGRDSADVVMALMIGAVNVSRALTDSARQRALLENCERMVLQLISAPEPEEA